MVHCNLYAKNEISTHLQIVSLGVKKQKITSSANSTHFLQFLSSLKSGWYTALQLEVQKIVKLLYDPTQQNVRTRGRTANRKPHRKPPRFRTAHKCKVARLQACCACTPVQRRLPCAHALAFESRPLLSATTESITAAHCSAPPLDDPHHPLRFCTHSCQRLGRNCGPFRLGDGSFGRSRLLIWLLDLHVAAKPEAF